MSVNSTGASLLGHSNSSNEGTFDAVVFCGKRAVVGADAAVAAEEALRATAVASYVFGTLKDEASCAVVAALVPVPSPAGRTLASTPKTICLPALSTSSIAPAFAAFAALRRAITASRVTPPIL